MCILNIDILMFLKKELFSIVFPSNHFSQHFYILRICTFVLDHDYPIDTNGIVATRLNGIVATGLNGIVATRLNGTVATRLNGIVATGLNGIVATRLNGIVATRLNGTVATRLNGTWWQPDSMV